MENILTSKLSIILGTSNETLDDLLKKIEELTKKNEELALENNKLKNNMILSNSIKDNQIEALRNMNRILNTEYMKLKNEFKNK